MKGLAGEQCRGRYKGSASAVLAETHNTKDPSLASLRRYPALRDQVVARYKKLNIPTYWAGINAWLEAHFDAKGKVSGVAIEYPRDAVRQYLSNAAMYDKGLARRFSAMSGNSAARRHH